MSKPLCCWWTILPRISIIKTEWRTIHETSTVMLHCNSVVTSQTQTFSALTCSFIRQLSMWHCSHLLLNAVLPRRWAPAVVDRYLLPARRSAANPLHAAAASNDGTDRQTVDRFVDPAPHTMRAVSIIGQAEGTTAGRLVNASPWALAGRRNSDLYHCRVWTWTLRIHSLIHSNRLLKTSSQDSRWFLPEFLVSISFQLLVLKGFMLIFSTRMAAD